MAMIAGGMIGGLTKQNLIDFIDRRVTSLFTGGSDAFRARVIEIVELAITLTTGRLVESAESTLKQVKEEFVKMQGMTTELEEKLKGSIQQIEDMRIAGVQFDLDAGEKMRSVEEKIIQINEAHRACMERINQKKEAVYTEATRQATHTGQQIVS